MSKTIRIFISSPGDVSDERDIARSVIKDMQRRFRDLVLEAVLWEDLPLPATTSFQQAIDVIVERQPVDIAIFILWARLGSPLAATITRPDGTEYRSGTEREFDLMLNAFKLSQRKRPVILAYTRDDDASFRQRFLRKEATGDQLRQLIEQHDLARAFVQERFHDEQGRNICAYRTYREPIDFARLLRTHLRNALCDIVDIDCVPAWTASPFRGLHAFDIEHAEIFFGREEETNVVLQRLRDQERSGRAFVAIVGASGSGKSSLALAGVAATLLNDSAEAREWKVARLTPGLRDRDVLRHLTQTIASQVPTLCTHGESVEDLVVALWQDPHLTVRLSILPALASTQQGSAPAHLLLVLDQLEELWTDRDISTDDRLAFFAAIEALTESGRVSCVATLRADFYALAQRIPAFLRLKSGAGQFDLVAPSATALQRMIREPARMAGLRFEQAAETQRRLDEVIIEDASRDPTALPLLGYALEQLYERRNGGELTFPAYESLGGIVGAIARRADEVYGDLTTEVKAALPEILPMLIAIESDGDQMAIRRRAELSELTATPGRQALTKALVDARFLATDKLGDYPVASFTHESLLERWDLISQWIEENRDRLGRALVLNRGMRAGRNRSWIPACCWLAVCHSRKAGSSSRSTISYCRPVCEAISKDR